MSIHFKYTYFSLFWLWLIIFPTASHAHAPDQSYIFLRVYDESIGGRFEITTDDLNTALDLGLDENVTLEELAPHLPAIQAYLIEKAAFSSSLEAYTIQFTEPDLLVLENLGTFVLLNFNLSGVSQVPEALNVEYNVLLNEDLKHQGLLVVEYNWKAGIIDNEAMVSLIFTRNDTRQQLSLTDASIMQGFIAMIKMGMWHIWIGLDHILFLLALVLPAVVRREPENQVIEIDGVAGGSATGALAVAESSWTPVARFKPAFIYVVKIITFFTIAHSITLSLAALEVIVLPSRFVESIIALSIGLAAYHNIRPLLKNEVWIIAFGFGLFHGFGFASVLGEKGLGGDYMTLSLLGFNLGVEIGQILIICLIFPVLFFIRKSDYYPKILVYGSILLIAIALYWFFERSLDVDFLLDNYIGAWVDKFFRFITPW
jgi:hypothetical protein